MRHGILSIHLSIVHSVWLASTTVAYLSVCAIADAANINAVPKLTVVNNPFIFISQI